MFFLQVFLAPTLSVPPEAGLPAVEDVQRDQEAVQSLEEKVAAGSQQQGARQLWQGRWLVQLLPQLQHTRHTATAFLRVSKGSQVEDLRPSSLTAVMCDPIPGESRTENLRDTFKVIVCVGTSTFDT